MIRLKFGGLLPAVFLLLSFGLTASAQYTTHLSVAYQGKCFDAQNIYNHYIPALNPSFPTKEACEALRSQWNKRVSQDGCTVTFSSSPCTGSPLGGSTEPGSGTIYKGSGSTYSANQANEVKDWAKDNATLARIIGGRDAVILRSVKTGDAAFDNLLDDDLTSFGTSEETGLPKDGEQNERVVRDDRPGFDDDAFKGKFSSLGQDNHSDDFKFVDPFKIQKPPVLEKVSTEVKYVPVKESFTNDAPAEEDESFIKKKYNQFKEWLDEKDMSGVHEVMDRGIDACSNMAETALSKGGGALSKIGGSIMGAYNSIKGAEGTKNFLEGYATKIVDQTKENATYGIKYGRPKQDYSRENQEEINRYAKKSVADKFMDAGFKAFFSGGK